MVRDLAIAQYEHVIEVIKIGNNGKLRNMNGVHICMELVFIEAGEALAYFKKNRPTEFLHPEFYKDRTYNETSSSWWYPRTEVDKLAIKPFNHANKQRIKFLGYLIKQLRKEPAIL